MNRQIRPASRLSVTLAVLAFGAVFLCGRTASAADPKADLIALLKGVNVDGYLFSMSEEPAATLSSLTDKNFYDVYSLPSGDANLVLRYSSVQDNATQKTGVYKSEIVQKGTALTLLVTDLVNNKPILKQDLPAAGPSCLPEGQFSSLSACVERFRCLNGGNLTCKANTTCQAQFAALTCCLTNGQAFSVHMIFPPTSLVCLIRAQIPDIAVAKGPF
ncbi:MAG TPA: hypothetical protein VLB76_06985 [Thermoanaerobaculia bacterium]|jgi:hypothetical protein|nr:hypothetical protein [Thermoanaerobaculia bacterium]